MSATNVLLALKEGAQAQLDELRVEREKLLGSLRDCQSKITELELHLILKDLNGNQSVQSDIPF